MPGLHLSHLRRRSMAAALLLAVGLTTALVGCGSSGASSDRQGAGGSSAGTASLDGLTIEQQKGAAVTKTIGADGGTIDLTAQDGTRFTFRVPAGALASDTKITGTPATLSGVDFPASLVMFEPTGLFFVEPATLAIEPAKEVPVGRQFMFGISDDASEIVAAPVDPKERATVVQVGHFSGWGLANTTDAQRAAMLERQASDAEARLQSQLGEVLGQERQRQLLGDESSSERVIEEFAKVSKEYEEQVIRPRLAAAGASCEATRRAVQTVLGFERQRQLLGAADGEEGGEALQVVLDALAEGGPCEREAIAECKAKEDPAIYLRFLLQRERTRQLLGAESEGGIDDLVKKAKRTCKPKRYTASGGGSGLSVSGPVEDLTKPFTLSGTFPGATVTFSYTPSDDRAGSYTAQFSGSGVTGSVAGTYTIAGDDDGPLTLTGKDGGCVDQVAGSCRNNTQTVTLTPVE